MNSSNGAMITGFSTTLLFCIAFFNLRKLFRERAERKAAAKEAIKILALNLTLMPYKEFEQHILNLFILEYDSISNFEGYPAIVKDNKIIPLLLDNSPNGLQVETLIRFLNAFTKNAGKEHIILSVNPLDSSVSSLLQNINVELNIFGLMDIYKMLETQNIILPVNPLLQKSPPPKHIERLKRFTDSRYSASFAFRYGFLLLLWSFVASYKIYYLVFSSLLIGFGIYSTIKRQKNQSKKIF